MAEATLETVNCENCGAGIRENTRFCYNCGRRYAESADRLYDREPSVMSDEAKTPLADLAAKLEPEDTERGDKLALAAAKRRKARVAPKKSAAIVWEAGDTRSGLFIFIVSLLMFLLVAAVVFVTVYWK